MNRRGGSSSAGMKLRPRSLLLATLLLPPFAARAAGPASGKSVFAQDCASCHGAAGKGDGPGAATLSPKPPDLTRSRATKEGIAGIVRDGRKACPSWKASLKEDEIAAVARFAFELQAH